MNPDWSRAYCRTHDVSPSVFFDFEELPDGRERTAARRAAQAICAMCPVQQQCDSYAERNSFEFGVWGGRTSNMRARARRRAREAPERQSA